MAKKYIVLTMFLISNIFFVSCVKIPDEETASIDKVVNIYRESMRGNENEFKKLKYIMLDDCKVVIKQPESVEALLSKKEFLNGLERLFFTSSVYGVELVAPAINETEKAKYTVKFIEGYLCNGEADRVDTKLVIFAHNGKYLIKEIEQRCQNPNDVERNIIYDCMKSHDYNPQKGLGDRYLGGGRFNANASISPDGKKIVFASLMHESSELYLINTDGSNLKRLTNSPYWEISPRFTPDGNSILFYSDQEYYDGEPYIYNLQNGRIDRFIPNLCKVENIIYSYDNLKIAFTASSENKKDIFICDSNRDNIKRITFNGLEKSSLIFSRNGTKIYFSQQWYETYKMPPRTVEIFSVVLDGNDLKRLTTNDREMKQVIAEIDDGILFLRQNSSNHYHNELWILDLKDFTSRFILAGNNGLNNCIVTTGNRGILFTDNRDGSFYEIYQLYEFQNSPTPLKLTDYKGYMSELGCFNNFVVYIVEPAGSPNRGKGQIWMTNINTGKSNYVCNNY